MFHPLISAIYCIMFYYYYYWIRVIDVHIALCSLLFIILSLRFYPPTNQTTLLHFVDAHSRRLTEHTRSSTSTLRIQTQSKSWARFCSIESLPRMWAPTIAFIWRLHTVNLKLHICAQCSVLLKHVLTVHLQKLETFLWNNR